MQGFLDPRLFTFFILPPKSVFHSFPFFRFPLLSLVCSSLPLPQSFAMVPYSVSPSVSSFPFLFMQCYFGHLISVEISVMPPHFYRTKAELDNVTTLLHGSAPINLSSLISHSCFLCAPELQPRLPPRSLPPCTWEHPTSLSLPVPFCVIREYPSSLFCQLKFHPA